MDHQAVGARVLDGGFSKQHERRSAKLDGDFRHALGETLSSTEIKWNIGPAPVIDLEFEGDESFGIRIRRDVGLVAIRRDSRASFRALAILAANRVVQNILGSQNLQCMQDFGLFVADSVGFERDGRFHGREREELEEVIGHHVFEGAGGFVESAAVFDANGLGGGNLHVIDVSAIPKRLDHAVGEAENHQVLDGFLAEVMVNTENLFFRQNLLKLFVQLLRGREIVTERFFHDDAGPLTVFFLGEADFAELLYDQREKVERNGQVVKEVSVRPVLFVRLHDLIFEALIRRGILKIALDVVDAIQKPLPQLRVHGMLFEFCDLLVEQGTERIGVHLVESEADNGELFRKKTFLLKVDEGRDELALSEVAAGAEDHHHAGRTGGSGINVIRVHAGSPVSAVQRAAEVISGQPFSRCGRRTENA